MSRKRGTDIPNTVIYALALVLGIVTVVDALLLVQPTPQSMPEAMHITGLQSSSQGTVGLFILGGCLTPLAQGWTLISLCSNVTNSSIPSVLSGIDYRYVMRWNETGQEFAIYSPSASSNPFSTFELNRSYFIYLNSLSGNIAPIGSGVNGDMNITLVQGWSTPSWPYESDSNFTRYFNASVHRYLMKWNTTDQAFVIWSPRMSAPPPSLMFVGDGQFIYSDFTNQLKYNKTNVTG
jgi:hypothetical protein